MQKLTFDFFCPSLSIIVYIEKIEKMQTEIIYRSIGVIKTPFKRIADMPIQPKGAHGIEGIVELIEKLHQGL